MPNELKEKKTDPSDLTWKEIRTTHLVQNEWIDFREHAYQLPDGKVFEPFYSYTRKDFVVVVAYDENGNLLCVRQFRQGIRAVTTEFPAGCIERKDGPTDSKNPDNAAEALAAAKRELREETGYESDQWTHLLTIPSSATISDNYAYLYEARNCRKISDQELDPTEFLHVEIHTPEELERMIHGGQFQQAIHALAWTLSKNRK